MKSIQLTRGEIALVDDSDFPWLSQWKWYWAPPSTRRGSGYAATVFTHWEGSHEDYRVCVRMHELLLPWREEYEIDHKDGDSLNNQRSNIRYGTRKNQCHNRAARHNSSTGYKGVSIVKLTNSLKYVVSITPPDGKRITPGRFVTPEEAAIAYNFLAIFHYGEFARLNEIHI